MPSAVGAVALAACTWSCCAHAAPVRLSVSPGGVLPSIEAALARARSIRQSGRAPSGVRIEVRRGTYRLPQTIVVGPDDSGTVIAAAPGERPILTGARTITGWRKRGTAWVAPMPPGMPPFRQLFVNGARRTRARSPNTGYHTVDGAIENVWRWGPGGAKEDRTPSWFRYRGGDIRPEWAASGSVEVVALQVWAEIRMPIRAIDPAARTVTLAGTSSPSNRETNARYWVENAPACLDAPGEWYLDATSREVAYIPKPGEDPRRCVIEAPALDELLRIEGDPASGRPVRDVQIRGLEFRCADWSLPPDGYVDVQAAFDVPAGVTVVGAERCTFVGCGFSRLGAWAVELGRACRGCRLERCEMTELGAGGIKVGEFARRPDARDHTWGNTIDQCRVRTIGQVYPAAVGIWIGQSRGNVVRRCEVSDTWQSGVSVGWSWGYEPSLARDNLIVDNDVHHIGQGRLSDLGGIYTLGVQPGTVIRGNRVHDIRSRSGGGWGIYLDEGSSGVTVEENVVHHTTSAGFFLHYGRDNVVRRNVFALSDEPNILRHRPEAHHALTFERNIVICSGGLPLGGEWSDGRFTIDRNLYWSAKGYELRFGTAPWDEWRARGHDTHSLIADPLFQDPARGDFRLKPGSPALRLGVGPAAGRPPDAGGGGGR